MAQARADQPTAEPPEPHAVQEEAPHRSAFGRVMALMIDALQAKAGGDAPGPATTRDAKPATAVRTTAIGTPLGIEVGEAFRLDAPATASTAARRRAGARAPEMPLAVQADQVDPGR